MKIFAITISILTIYFLQTADAAQTCKNYVTDQWPDSRYTVETLSGDNVVTDNQARLMWKQCSEGLTGPSCSTGSITSYTWLQALDLAYTEDFAGFADWRIPNQKELRTLVVRNCYSPSINEIVFPNTPNSSYWSSSPVAASNTRSWVTSFNDGSDSSNWRGIEAPVRLVRSSGQ